MLPRRKSLLSVYLESNYYMPPTFALLFFIPAAVAYSLIGIVFLKVFRKPVTVVSLNAFVGGGVVFGILAIGSYGITIGNSGNSTLLVALVCGAMLIGSIVAGKIAAILFDESRDSWIWWNGKRRAYNLALLFSAISASILNAAIGWVCILAEPWAPVLISGIGFLIAIWTANIAYCAGPILEPVIPEAQIDTYRKSAFRFGYWFSVALPFSIPLLLGIKCGQG